MRMLSIVAAKKPSKVPVLVVRPRPSATFAELALEEAGEDDPNVGVSVILAEVRL